MIIPSAQSPVLTGYSILELIWKAQDKFIVSQ